MRYGFLVSTLGFLLTARIAAGPSDLEYDYIVVGGGIGGGVLAVELAKAGHSTLLVEAGPNYFSNYSRTPGLWFRTLNDPEMAFTFKPKLYSENETKYQQEPDYLRAGVLGGCALHNTMITVYPNKRDFDLLVRLTNDQNFDEKRMREKYFKKMERNQYPHGTASPRDHGYAGWFPISYSDPLRIFGWPNVNRTQLMDVQNRGMFNAFGGDLLYDSNGYVNSKLGTDQEARFFAPMDVDRGTAQRFNHARYIMDAVRTLPYFDVWTDTLVTRIILDKNRVAKGIEFRRGKYLYKASPKSTEQNRARASRGRAMALREIIVAGGAFNAPQLLMLSGIGDRDQLRANNITPLVHLPGVGQNLQDHYSIPYTIKLPRPLTTYQGCDLQDNMKDTCYRKYIERRTGPYTSNGLISIELVKSRPELNEPNLATFTFPNFRTTFTTSDVANENEIVYDSITRQTFLGFSSSVGVVRLRSSDPYDMPYINFNRFNVNGEKDIRIATNHIRRLRKESAERLRFNYTEQLPGPNIKSDEEFEDFLRRDGLVGVHACCTTKIGKDNDPMAVLNGKFQVRGVKNLRVVSASVFPEVPAFFPSLFIHMMSLKAADDILNDAY
ncbi:uncharacterized protein VTP21DRAFT_1070 [Calcarisporiella thermophila]|uniref:uncharacterized protein n=1 Tax=Calcarisporiella thermophila TaxID=911321 RepID=UPI00374332BC